MPFVASVSVSVYVSASLCFALHVSQLELRLPFSVLFVKQVFFFGSSSCYAAAAAAAAVVVVTAAGASFHTAVFFVWR